MRSRKKDLAYLDDIRESAAMIIDRLRGRRLPDFVENVPLQDGVLRRLSIIGEAAKCLTDEARKKYPGVPWREMTRFRDLAVHHYWDLDMVKIWNFVQEDILLLLEVLGESER